MTNISLHQLFPEFATELRAELAASGEADLAEQVIGLEVVACSYDSECNAAYIRVESARALNIVEENIIGTHHRRTVPVKHRCDVYLDADNFNRITGIELLDAGEYAERLLAYRSSQHFRERKSVNPTVTPNPSFKRTRSGRLRRPPRSA